MKNTLPFLFVIILGKLTYANDGAFLASGNHLIPIVVTDISIKKEILTVKKIRNQFIEVTVYYEFFNPSKEKKLVVGFEAFSPSGDAETRPKNGLQPYMRDFTVELNGQILQYNVAYVEDSQYVKNGIITGKDLNAIKKNAETESEASFFYVYHFNAGFKKGLNIIKHTYSYDLSSYVGYYYDFSYVLTTAKRWANNKIDDFTLVVDMDEFEAFNIKKTFFSSINEWLINGIGKSSYLKADKFSDDNGAAISFYVQKGNLIFHKKNFIPNGDLFLYSSRIMADGASSYIPFSYYYQDEIEKPKDDFEKKVFANLPFARRGLVFKNKELRNYCEKLDWYIPNPNYIPDVKFLTEIEKKWIAKWE